MQAIWNGIYINFLLTGILIFSITNSSAFMAPTPKLKKIKLEIHTSFKKNKKVWGTYRLSKEQFWGSEKTEDKLSQITSDQHQFPKETLIFKGGHLFFINSIQDEHGKSKLLVKTFPYTYKNKNFTVKFSEKKECLLELYRIKIKNLLIKYGGLEKKLANIDPDQIEIESMKCQKSKSGLDCRLPIVLNVPASTNFPQI